MHFVAFVTHNQDMERDRSRLSEAFGDYLHNPTDHPEVTVHHGGPTLGESDDTVNGLLLVLEAPSIEAAQAFVSDSPYAKAGIVAESQIRAWNWLTGRPG